MYSTYVCMYVPFLIGGDSLKYTVTSKTQQPYWFFLDNSLLRPEIPQDVVCKERCNDTKV